MKNTTWNAKDYAQNSQSQFGWAHELIKKMNLQKNMNVLDVGCGDGRITNMLAQIAHEGMTVGIDASTEMVALAQQTFTSNNLEFINAPAEDFTVPYSIDYVFSNACLHWVHDHSSVLQNVKKVLSDNGKFLLQMGGEGNAETVLEALDRLAKSEFAEYLSNHTLPYYFASPDEYYSICDEVGLALNRAELIPKEMKHTRDNFAGWFRTTWFPTINLIPEPKQNDFINKMTDIVFELGDESDGIATVPMIRLEVEGRNKLV